MRSRHHMSLYRSERHVIATFLFLALPFVFFLLFSRIVHIATGTLMLSILVSSWRLAVAYLIAAVIGWICAVSFYHGRRALIALPVFDVLQSFPTFALLPMAILFFGPSTLTVIFFLVIAMVWPIFFSMVSSLKMIRHDWQEAAEVFNLSGWLYVKKFLIPVSLPGFIIGSIVGLGDGWEALVATEIIVGLKTGLGSFFLSFANNFTITAFGILGFLLFVFSINKVVWLSLLEWSHHMMEE